MLRNLGEPQLRGNQARMRRQYDDARTARAISAPRLEELLILLFVAIATYTTLACASRFLSTATTDSLTAVQQTYAATPLADDMRRDGPTGLDADLLLHADINAATAAVEQRDDVPDVDSPSDRDLADEADAWHGQPFP